MKKIKWWHVALGLVGGYLVLEKLGGHVGAVPPPAPLMLNTAVPNSVTSAFGAVTAILAPQSLAK